MKIRNKKTGEIISASNLFAANKKRKWYYGSLKEFNEEWEDYEEPKEVWFISNNGQIHEEDGHDRYREERKEIGNYFETKEEAERAVEKLKAWKRLKDKGLKFRMWEWEFIYEDNKAGEIVIKAHIDDATDEDGNYPTDLDLLFGGEE